MSLLRIDWSKDLFSFPFGKTDAHALFGFDRVNGVMMPLIDNVMLQIDALCHSLIVRYVNNDTGE